MLNAAARILRRQCMPAHPVHVRRVQLQGEWGHCWLRKRKHRKVFLIAIDSRMPDQLALETLVHEWAHALSWYEPGTDHSVAWGRAYARCYRAVIEE